MKKFMISALSFFLLALGANAATFNAADRVSTVGKTLLTKNDLPSKTDFKVINGSVDNSNVSATGIIYIPKDQLEYAGNDNEVAAVVAHEIGSIINGKSSKEKLRNIVQNTTGVSNTVASSFINSKTQMKDNKDADITGVDLMIKANYNPLAMIVVLTKQPSTSTLEALSGKPSNSERAMNIFDYLSYNYPSKIKAGYACQEYRAFLVYAEPIAAERNSDKKKLEKFNKEQEKAKKERAKNLAQYKATGGISGWDATYAILNDFVNGGEK